MPGDGDGDGGGQGIICSNQQGTHMTVLKELWRDRLRAASHAREITKVLPYQQDKPVRGEAIPPCKSRSTALYCTLPTPGDTPSRPVKQRRTQSSEHTQPS